MKRRILPNTDLAAAAICLGSTGIGSAIEADTSFRMLDRYVAAGGNFIDTAAVYANWLPGERSVSEKTIGRWLQQRGQRHKLIIATKGAHPDLDSMHVPRMLRREIESDLNQSLRNLQTDVIDLYWLHRDDPSQPVEAILAILNDQVRAGKIRYFGCSNWRVERIEAAQAAAAAAGSHGFVANQMRWSLAVIDPAGVADKTTVSMDDALFAYHLRSGLAAIPYSSQAGGLFQKLVAGQPAVNAMYPRRPNQARLARVQALVAATGLTVSQIVLGYLQSQPFATVPIVGCRTLAQLEDSLTAADVQLTAEQVAFLQGRTLNGPA